MALIQLRNITKSFPDNDLFTDLSIQIDKQDRIGLIGDNGTGKSTLMEIIAGEEHFEQGEIVTINNYNFGHLTQEFKLDESCKLFEAMLKVYDDLARLEAKLNQLEEEMAKQEGEDLAKIMDEYGQLREKYEQEGGYEYESKIKKILFGLGFNEGDLEKSLADLSGGEKTRASLAKLLLEEPDLLLLDEPGNHLDLAAKEWLEDYLQGYDGAFMLISHDRFLLDKLVDKIWELERGRFEEYNCSYRNYLKEKELRLKNWRREYEKQQKEIKRLKKYIRKNKAGVDSKQARGRQKKLERMKKIPKPPKIKVAEFEFQLQTESGHDVLKVESLSKSYDDKKLFSDFKLRVYKGDKIGVVGPNGSGKSTFLKLLLGEKEADNGKINFGSNINLGYYDQEHSNLTPENNLIEELQKVSDVKEEKIRNFLGSFLFTGSEVLEKISTLSGGEKARVALAKLAIQDLNLLIMDEPTNHLDIKSREVLEKALKKYFGTIIVISHDRYFLNQIVDRIIAFKAGEIKKYKGNYSYYRRQYKKELAAQKRKEKKEQKTKEKKVRDNKSKKQAPQINLEDLEEKIMKLEDELKQIENKLADEDVISNQERLKELTTEYETIQEELADYYNDWEKII